MTSGAGGLVVTIDGPAGCGKSSVAQQLARRLGWQVLDTGAMYRAAALLALRSGIEPSDGAAVAAVIRRSRIDFDWRADPPVILLDGEPVEEAIRSVEASAAASAVAARPEVRAILVESQRRIASAMPRLVSEGRDQGSVVFPDALVRFFLDAPVEERAHRRLLQLEQAGERVDELALRRAIRERDEHDRARAVAPLVRPPGAVVVDTGGTTLEQVVDRLEREVRDALRRVGAEGTAGTPRR
ncbi:MAG: (d)CMP kinase [Phycisphaerae bacterium]|nr:(d)CMP kinase [Phycisphaerae bacterium]